MTNEDMKKCLKCLEEKELTNFYKVNEFYYQSKCKTCHNTDRKKYPINSKKYYNYKKKGTGILKLGEEKRNGIKNDILGGKLNYKEICLKHDLKYQTLISWIRKGQLPKKETIKEKIRKIKEEKKNKGPVLKVKGKL
tara:strand:+ start:31 stop:441 length:411 start_codon:yes stop_codon:yes gene_type:complete